MNGLLEKASSHLSKESAENLKTWLSAAEFSPYQSEIKNLIEKENWEEIEDSFYTRIRIGTGGIRGKIGPGRNRINMRSIGEAAQGLSNFIEDYGDEAKERGVVVSHEVRKFSREFAELTCSVLAANGIKTFLFDGFKIKIQFNEGRIYSTSAKVDVDSVKNRSCFLCENNLPEEQKGIKLLENYLLLCNPYPVFPEHFTIVTVNHKPQEISSSFSDFSLINFKSNCINSIIVGTRASLQYPGGNLKLYGYDSMKTSRSEPCAGLFFK